MPSAKKNALGRGARALRRGGGNPAAKAKLKANADRHALEVFPVILEIHSAGITSFSGIAAELNNLGIPTARRRRWHQSTVCNLLARVRRLL
jgi:hypothetical protein